MWYSFCWFSRPSRRQRWRTSSFFQGLFVVSLLKTRWLWCFTIFKNNIFYILNLFAVRFFNLFHNFTGNERETVCKLLYCNEVLSLKQHYLSLFQFFCCCCRWYNLSFIFIIFSGRAFIWFSRNQAFSWYVMLCFIFVWDMDGNCSVYMV